MINLIYQQILNFLYLNNNIISLIYLDKEIILNEIKFSFYDKNILLNEYNIFFTIFCFLVFINAFNMFDGINLQSKSYIQSLCYLVSKFFSQMIY